MFPAPCNDFFYNDGVRSNEFRRGFVFFDVVSKSTSAQEDRYFPAMINMDCTSNLSEVVIFICSLKIETGICYHLLHFLVFPIIKQFVNRCIVAEGIFILPHILSMEQAMPPLAHIGAITGFAFPDKAAFGLDIFSHPLQGNMSHLADFTKAGHFSHP